MTPDEYELFKKIEALVLRSNAKTQAKLEEKIRNFREERRRERSEISRITFYR